jgi:SPX domain protein involved in polyphosphate accumulation
MGFRVEHKLYINKENLLDFKEFLNKKSAQGIHQPRVIESLYFDNHNFDIHKDSVEGLTPRKKIRVRTYPNHNDKKIYLEVKNSSVEGRFKTRKVIDNDELKDRMKQGIFDNQYGLCLPKMYVKYDREYLRLKDVRISIDTNITYRSYETNFVVKDDRVIAELKTSAGKDMDELTEDFPIQRIRFSKYCLGVEKLFHH